MNKKPLPGGGERRISGEAILGIVAEGALPMSINEHLPPQARKELKKVGWAKGIELAKVARRDRQQLDRATWLHKARHMLREKFRQEVEKERKYYPDGKRNRGKSSTAN